MRVEAHPKQGRGKRERGKEREMSWWCPRPDLDVPARFQSPDAGRKKAAPTRERDKREEKKEEKSAVGVGIGLELACRRRGARCAYREHITASQHHHDETVWMAAARVS